MGSDESTLSELCLSITKGTTPTAAGGRFKNSGINFVKSECLSYDGSIDKSKFAFIDGATHEQLKRSQIAEGDILYSIAGVNLGKCGVATAEMLPANTNQAVAVIRVDSQKASPRFVSYVLRDKAFVQTVLRGVAQSAQPNVNLSDIGRFPIPRWPLGEQCAIAHILGTLDDKIELNRRMNVMLEAMARALFKSWFVDFDPVRAKAEGRDPDIPQEIADLFPDAFEESELGEIPRGWEAVTIDSLADIVGGSTPSTKEPIYWGGTHGWATPKDLSALSVPVLLDTERRVTDAGLSQISSGLLPAGTVLLSSRAPIGYLAVAEIPVAINQGFIAMKPRPDISNIFLLLWASASHEQIVSRANGSTFLEISKSSFRPIPVIEPTMPVMRTFDRLARPLYSRIVSCVLESRTLASLRDTLLPKLISGELRVKDAQRQVVGVA